MKLDLSKWIKSLGQVCEVFMPQAAAQQTYERLYQEVYQRMYKQLKPLYQSIREITGYPS